MPLTAFPELDRRGNLLGEEAEELLIVCCGCKRVRVGPLEFVEDESGLLWEKRDAISHTLCPECADQHYGFSRERYVEVVCRRSA